MIYKNVLCLFCTLIVEQSFSQISDTITSGMIIRYDTTTEDFFKEYKDAKLIVDYYCTTGISTQDRYSYEIILIDSVLMFAFNSPNTENYNHVSYENKRILPNLQFAEFKIDLTSAKLTQIKNGIPYPNASANNKEVLIVKFDNINIRGGLFNYVLYESSKSQKEIEENVAFTRKESSSIGGDYEKVFSELKQYISNLDSLITQATVK